MKKTIIVECEVEVEMDDKKIGINLMDYQNIVDSTADIEDMFEQVAWNEVRHGGFCEGVGENGTNFTAKIVRTETYESV